LRQDYQQFTARDAEVLVVNPGEMADVKAFSESLNLPFPMLVDPGHEVANRSGQEVNRLKLGRMPALVVLDRDGVVRYEHRGGSMMDTPKNSDVLAVLDRLNGEWAGQMAPEISEAQVARQRGSAR
jgi:peroxiredoxin Q/BCP